MSEKANKVWIGAFVLGALALVLVAVTVIGSGSLFSSPLRFVMFFESSLKGLTTGSPVVFRGVPIGRVSNIRISGDVDAMEFLIPVYVELDATVMKDIRQAAPGSSFAKADAAYLHTMAQRGLYGRLNNQSLLTGQLLIELNISPEASLRDAFMPMPAYNSLPVIPTIPSQFDTIWQRLSELPVDRIIHNLIDVLGKIEEILESQAVKNLPANLEAVLSEARPTLSTLNATLESFNHLAVSLQSAGGMADRQVSETLERVRRLTDAYAALAAQFERGLEGVRGVVGPNTAFVLEFARTIHEIGETAKAVRSLAGTLERNPESLLLGKGTDRK